MHVPNVEEPRHLRRRAQRVPWQPARMNNDEMLLDELTKLARNLVKVVEGLANRVEALEAEFVKRDKAAAKARRDQRRSF